MSQLRVSEPGRGTHRDPKLPETGRISATLESTADPYVLKERNSEAVAFMNEPRYELGEHQGAEFCGTCHTQTYAEWQTNSRHAQLTVSTDSIADLDSV